MLVCGYEALKPRELRYRLLWGHRYGFIRAAIRNRTPISPLAAIGSDELFDFVGDAYALYLDAGAAMTRFVTFLEEQQRDSLARL